MKKNRMMRSASALLVMVLMTTSVISGTFAKYVTTNKAEDTARVAKWGVTVDASGNLFGENYLTGNVNTPTISEDEDDNKTVISVELGDSSDDKLVAPGTKSEHGITFGIKGKPEVDTKVSAIIEAKDIYLKKGTYGVMQKVTVNETNFADYVKNGLFTVNTSGTYSKVGDADEYVAEPSTASQPFSYCQIAYTATVGEEGYYPVEYTWSGDNNIKKVTKVAEDIVSKLNPDKKTVIVNNDGDSTDAGVKYTVADVDDEKYAKFVNANTELGDALKLDAEILTWEWKFGAAETLDKIGKAVNPNSNDARDTILGDLAAGGDVVAVTTNEVGGVAVPTAVTKLTVSTTEGEEGLVKNGSTEVGCIRTAFDIKITVEQVD